MTKIEAINKVIAYAKSQVGYKETYKNVNKYAEELDKTDMYNGKKNGYPWCDIFFDYLLVHCFGIEKAQKMLYQPKKGCGAGCCYSAQYYKDNKAFSKTPTLGSQIFFDWDRDGEEDHTGIVVAINGNRITTVEGNSNDMVSLNNWDKNDINIVGYGVPKYELVATEKTPTKTPTKTPSKTPTKTPSKSKFPYTKTVIPKIGLNVRNSKGLIQRALICGTKVTIYSEKKMEINGETRNIGKISKVLDEWVCIDYLG